MKRISLNEVKNDNYAKLYKFLFTGEFIEMSDSAKILYCLLRDRMQLSVKKVKEGNDYWLDKNGDIFIHATKEDIKAIMNCSDKKAIKLKKELVTFKLIEDIRIGYNKPNKIYILNVDYLESIDKTRKCTKDTIGSVKSTLQEVYKVHSNKTNINKTNINKTENNNNTEITNITNKTSDIENIKSEIESTLQCEVNIKILKDTIAKHNLLLDDIRYYLSHWNKFDHITKNNPAGFLLKLAINKAPLPKRQQGQTKPDQAYNFEQRVYDDDYFDSLYDNF